VHEIKAFSCAVPGEHPASNIINLIRLLSGKSRGVKLIPGLPPSNGLLDVNTLLGQLIPAEELPEFAQLDRFVQENTFSLYKTVYQ